MAQGDTKVFYGQLYYEDNGKWVPYYMASFGGGGNSGPKGLSRNSIINLINQFAGGGKSLIPYASTFEPDTTIYASSFNGSTTMDEDKGNFTSPIEGSFNNLTVYVFSNASTTNSVVTIRKSTGGGAFADTVQKVTILPGFTGLLQGPDSAVTMLKGDRISFQIESGSSEQETVITAGLEISG